MRGLKTARDVPSSCFLISAAHRARRHPPPPPCARRRRRREMAGHRPGPPACSFARESLHRDCHKPPHRARHRYGRRQSGLGSGETLRPVAPLVASAPSAAAQTACRVPTVVVHLRPCGRSGLPGASSPNLGPILAGPRIGTGGLLGRALADSAERRTADSPAAAPPSTPPMPPAPPGPPGPPTPPGPPGPPASPAAPGPPTARQRRLHRLGLPDHRHRLPPPAADTANRSGPANTAYAAGAGKAGLEPCPGRYRAGSGRHGLVLPMLFPLPMLMSLPILCCRSGSARIAGPVAGIPGQRGG